MNNKLKVIDLFAGAGGLSYGFANDSYFKIVAANEICPKAAMTYQLNHPDVPVYCKDIKDFGLDDLKKDFSMSKGEIDIVLGGPPCQAYSTIGKRIADDPRGRLFMEYYRVLSEISPKMFLFENVRGLLSIQKGDLFKKIISLFEGLGYNVKYTIINAANYGMPQIRERVIIFGSKINTNFSFPKPSHCDLKTSDLSLFNENLKPYLTLSEAIGDLPLIESGQKSEQYLSNPQNAFQVFMRQNAPDKLMDHESPKHGEKLIKIMETLKDGGTPADLPEEIRPKSGFANTYCKLWWNRPSTTITRNLGTPSSSRCIHPKAPRPLTTREGARIQGFPDDYIFYGSRSDKNLQIGNAVPTFLSIALKDAIKNYLFNLS